MRYWYDYNLRTVYERLRKRSYRRYLRAEYGGVVDNWRVYQHKAYVKGLNDAINALADQQR